MARLSICMASKGLWGCLPRNSPEILSSRRQMLTGLPAAPTQAALAGGAADGVSPRPEGAGAPAVRLYGRAGSDPDRRPQA